MCQFEKNGRRVPVADYWCNKMRERRPLNHPNLKTVKVKAGRGFIEIPPEFCQLMPGQKPKVSFLLIWFSIDKSLKHILN